MTPREEAVGRALTLHATVGLIQRWHKTPINTWVVTGTDKSGEYTFPQIEAFCDALASANQAMMRKEAAGRHALAAANGRQT